MRKSFFVVVVDHKSSFSSFLSKTTQKPSGRVERDNLSNCFVSIAILIKLNLYDLLTSFLEVKIGNSTFHDIDNTILKSYLTSLIVNKSDQKLIKNILTKLSGKIDHKEIISLLSLIPDSKWCIDFINDELSENPEYVKILNQMSHEQSQHTEKIIDKLVEIDSNIFKLGWDIDVLSDNVEFILNRLPEDILSDDLQKKALDKIRSPDISIKHKLRFVIPLLLFTYAAEIELSEKQMIPTTKKGWVELLLKKGKAKKEL
jgi:hypothetical protein